MKVALTGATGIIGSHILTELHEHGHEVTALLRDHDQADIGINHPHWIEAVKRNLREQYAGLATEDGGA